MINNSLKTIILAAGESKRILSSKSKILHTIGGKTILGHVLDNIGKIISKKNTNIVISPKLNQLRNVYKKINFSFQKKPLGTAHAVLSSKKFYSKSKEDILILYADNPFIDEIIIKDLVNLKKERNSDIILLAVDTHKKNEYGRIILNYEDKVEKIVEFKDATIDQKEISLCNSGIMLLKNEVLRKLITKIKSKNKKKEYYLTDIVGLANKNNFKVDYVKSSFLKTLGVNTKQELAIAEEYYQNILREKFISAGIKLLDPKSVFFNHDTKIGNDVTIEPNVFFGPDVTIKNNVHIKAFSHIEGVKILDNAVIGPFARLRPGSVLKKGSRVGNFVEVKKSTIGKGSKVNHLSYIGDSKLGKEVNIGAGTITCNYDGIKKNKTNIKDRVFIGSNSSLVAPVTINKNSVVGAGSVITKNVKKKTLALTRSKQVEIKNYKRKK